MNFAAVVSFSQPVGALMFVVPLLNDSETVKLESIVGSMDGLLVF